MDLRPEDIEGLGIALNEAALLGLEVDPVAAAAVAIFDVLTLPKVGLPPADTQVSFVFKGVARVAASLRRGFFSDPDAEVELFELNSLLETVQSFDGQSIYGWEFFDLGPRPFAEWEDRLSLDWQSGSGVSAHTIDLSQENPSQRRCLDVRIWFDDLALFNSAHQRVVLSEFIEGGKRWWEGLFAGDWRTQGKGIVPGA